MGGRGSSSTTAESFTDQAYWLQHRPSDLEAAANHEGASLIWDIANPDGVFPGDMLQHPEYYLEPYKDKDVKESVAILKRIQGDPEAEVTVYRGSPSDDLNRGDWVTLSRSYAEKYAGDGAYSDNPSSRVGSFKTKAKYLTWDGDSWLEFGYWGKKQKAR